MLCSSLCRPSSGELFRTAGTRTLRDYSLRWSARRGRLLGLRRCKYNADVFMNRLPLVVILGMSLAVWPGDGLGRFIGLEPQIPRLVFVGFGVVAKPVVAQHQVVMRLQILGIDGERLFEFLNRVGVALLQKQDAPKLVTHHAVARKL